MNGIEVIEEGRHLLVLLLAQVLFLLLLVVFVNLLRGEFALVPGLDHPVLIAWGRQDRTISVQHAYRAAYRIPGAELVIYDNCGHLPMYEKADDFNRDLVGFLRRQAQAPARRPRTAAKS